MPLRLGDVFTRGGVTRTREAFSKPIDQLYDELKDALQKDRVFVVAVFDDLDRLSDAEVLDVAMLVKAVGHFKNVSYLLSYDRTHRLGSRRPRHTARTCLP